MIEVLAKRMLDSSGIDGVVERFPLRHAQNQALRSADMYIRIIHSKVEEIEAAMISVQVLGR